MSIKLRTPAGGSLELKADDTLPTDEVVVVKKSELDKLSRIDERPGIIFMISPKGPSFFMARI